MMNTHECQFVQEISTAVRSGTWNNQMREHLATCSTCRETIVVAQAMNSVRETVAQKISTIPDYRLLWLKAQFTQKQEKLSALDLVTLLGLSLVGAIAFIGMLFWKLPQMRSLKITNLAELSSNWLPAFPLSIPVAVVVAFVIAVWVFSLEMFFTRK